MSTRTEINCSQCVWVVEGVDVRSLNLRSDIFSITTTTTTTTTRLICLNTKFYIDPSLMIVDRDGHVTR